MNSVIITFNFTTVKERECFLDKGYFIKDDKDMLSSLIKYLSDFLVNINEQSFILEITHLPTLLIDRH